MNSLFNFVSRFFYLFKVWTVVSPWEQALRVRLGKHVTLLGPGVHWCFVCDRVYRQTTRMRACALGAQTVTTKDGKTITISASVWYELTDIERLYQTLHHAQDFIENGAQGAIAGYVHSHTLAECAPEVVAAEAFKQLDYSFYGIRVVRLRISDYAAVRTYRIINDPFSRNTYGDYLNTNRVETAGAPPEVV